MPFTNHTRIELFLPCNLPAERRAADLAVRLRRDLFGGVTRSLLDEPVFIGSWRGAVGWVEDAVAIAFADTVDAQATIETKVEQIHREVASLYQRAGSPQDAFWITVSPLDVLAEV